MNKRTKTFLVYATALAILSTVLLIAINILCSDLIVAWLFPRDGETPVPWPLIILVAWELLTVLLICGLIVFYMMHIVKTNRISRRQKVIHAVFILLAHILAMPIYWYLFIKPDLATDSHSQQ